MKKILLLSVLLLVSFSNFNCGNKNKVNQKPQVPQNGISDYQKAQQLLIRTKNLLLEFPTEKDIYGVKNVFDGSVVTTCIHDDGTWNFSIEGQPYLIFLVPTQHDFDEGCPNMNAVMVTKSGKINDVEFPFIVINPMWLQIAKTEVDLDYLATCMVHESIHCRRFMGVTLGKLKQISSTEREKEAYTFQFRFLPMVLERNNLQKSQIPQAVEINSHKDMIVAASKIDVANGGKLGMLSSLVLQNAYLEKCLPFLVLPGK